MMHTVITAAESDRKVNRMKQMKYLAALLAAVTAVLPVSTAGLTVCAMPQQIFPVFA